MLSKAINTVFVWEELGGVVLSTLGGVILIARGGGMNEGQRTFRGDLYKQKMTHFIRNRLFTHYTTHGQRNYTPTATSRDGAPGLVLYVYCMYVCTPISQLSRGDFSGSIIIANVIIIDCSSTRALIRNIYIKKTFSNDIFMMISHHSLWLKGHLPAAFSF